MNIFTYILLIYNVNYFFEPVLFSNKGAGLFIIVNFKLKIIKLKPIDALIFLLIDNIILFQRCCKKLVNIAVKMKGGAALVSRYN